MGKLFCSNSKENNCCKIELGKRSGDEFDEVSLGIFWVFDIRKCLLFERLDDILSGLYIIIDYLSDIKRNEYNRIDWYFLV